VETAKLWNNKRYRPMLITLRLLRTGLAILYFSVYLLSTFSWVVAGLGILAVVTLAIVFSGRIHRLYIKIEEQFFANFYNRETEQAKSDRKELAPWDAHIVQYVLPAGSVFAAKTLKELAMREQLGINVAMIKRGDGYTIAAPQRHEQLYPGDTLYLLGTEAEIEKFKSCADVINHNNTVDTDKKVVLAKVEITDGNPFIGHTIRQSGIREQTNGLVAGIERNSRRILNPESDMIISLGDLIWLVGDEDLIKRFTSHYQVKEKA
jgi:CPA2 family monovalent cation:H+ antiporter-2